MVAATEGAMVKITGTVGASGKYLVTSIPVDSKVNAVLKIVFENNTGGTNLALIAGSAAEFEAGTGGKQISDSGGPGFMFLTIIDVHQLEGKHLWVKREVGTGASQFTLTID
jgi:hypothetical protein